MKLSLLGLSLGLGVAVSAAGCVAGVESDAAYGVAADDEVPPTVVASPAVVYEGHPTYFYRDRWYFRSGSHWHYYRHEPGELHRRRAAR